MHRRIAVWWSAAALFGLPVASAIAQTLDVKNLDITQGSLEIGLDNSIMSGPLPSQNRSAHDQSIDWGVREWWRLSAVMKLENPTVDNFRASRVAVENIFVLRPLKQSNDIGLGLFAAVEASINDATTNAFVFGPIVATKWDRLSFALNPFLEQTFGRNREQGLHFTYGWQAKYDIREGLAVGIEGYGHVGDMSNSPPLSDQEHRIGPVLFTEIALGDLKLTPDVGVLFGLTRATPDVTIKFNVGVALR